MKRHLFCTLPFAVVVALLGDQAPAAPGQPQFTLELVLKAGRERQARVRSAQFKFATHRTDMKGSMTPPRDPRSAPSDLVIPPTDVMHDVVSLLALDGEKMRLETNEPEWSVAENGFIRRPYVAVFDGEIAKSLYASGSPKKPWPQGTVYSQPHLARARSSNLAPLLMTFRPEVPWMRVWQLADMTVTGRTALLDDRRCHELSSQQPGNPWSTRVWVDSARDHVIARCVMAENEQMRLQIDIRYVADREAGWIPSSWDEVSLTPAAKMRYTARTTVTSSTINPGLSKEDFELVFPPSTAVVDEKSHRDYIVKPSGEERLILPAEYGAKYQDLVSSETGDAIPPDKRPFWTRGRIILAAGAFGAVVLFFWRSWRRKVVVAQP